MRDKRNFAKNFNWRMLLIRLLVNMLALFITVLVVPKVYFVDRRLIAWIVMAIGLGLLNAIVKPVIQFLTLRFIFATVGLVLIIINSIILYMLSWLMPDLFAVTNIFWAFVAGAVLGLSSTFFDNLLGLTTPIVSEKYPEIRQRVKDRQFYRTQAELARIGVQETGAAQTLAAAKVMVLNSNPTMPTLLSSEASKESKPAIQQEKTISPGMQNGEGPISVEDTQATPSDSTQTVPALHAIEKVVSEPEDITSMVDEIVKFNYPTDYIEGIGPTYKSRLSDCGIITIKDLLEHGVTPKERDALSEQTGISRNLLVKWIDAADLMRVKGVSSEYANLLVAAGVASLIELSMAYPDPLFETILALNEEKKLVRKPPARPQVEDWINQAEQLQRLIVE